ncbi:MAG TPA: hypothetical protein PKK00_14190 [Bacteroidales bacterium]|nr:hypothetical protein [Bacteroidales bacterium]HPS17412.1 hypothetical protein [Bacteroidales bacterium]
MSRKKRITSKVIDNAKKRLAGLKAISATIDFGNNLSVATYETAIQDIENMLDSYNELLSQTDAALNDFLKKESDLREMNLRIVDAVASVYGHDSNEYEKVGRIRKSEHKRPVRRRIEKEEK